MKWPINSEECAQMSVNKIRCIIDIILSTMYVQLPNISLELSTELSVCRTVTLLSDHSSRQLTF